MLTPVLPPYDTPRPARSPRRLRITLIWVSAVAIPTGFLLLAANPILGLVVFVAAVLGLIGAIWGKPRPGQTRREWWKDWAAFTFGITGALALLVGAIIALIYALQVVAAIVLIILFGSLFLQIKRFL